MANNISNMLNSKFRLSGMASGLDTESMVKQLMKVEKYKVDKVKQDKQVLEWRRDDYRSMTTLLTSFKNDFFDVLKPASNMRSTNSYKQYSAVSSNSTAISATATSAAVSGSHTITATQLATAANAVSSAAALAPKDLISSSDIPAINFPLTVAAKDFNITIAGSAVENIQLTGTFNDITALRDGIQTEINNNINLNGKVSVQVIGSKLQFESLENKQITLTDGSVSLLSDLNIASGSTNRDVGINLVTTKLLQSGSNIDNFNFANQDFNVTLNGVTKNIKLNGNYANIAGLKTAIQSSIDTAFGAGKITVGNNTDKLYFTSANSKVTLASGATDALAQLKLTSGASNRLNLYEKLNATNINTPLSGTLAFNINGVNFSFDTATKSMNDVMTEINSSAANVMITYSEVSDQFTLMSKTKGAGAAITINSTSGNLFGTNSAIGITAASISNGKDAIFNLDGVDGIVRSDNTFTVDGVSYTVNEINKAVTVTVNQNVDGIYDKIKNFIDKYNEVVSKVNGELQEERDKDFLPLTDEQRESMSEEDIKNWESKAKSGMLRNDNILTNVVDSMRRALYDSVKDVPGGLSSLGITTDNYFLSTKGERGKLIIDETKLKEAIKNSPDKVMNIFAKESTVAYSPDLNSTQKSTRYNESGIVHRIYDILQDNIRTTRNNEGKKGILLEKAGVIGDMTEFDSLIPDEIQRKESIIADMMERLYDKENSYYQKFAALEKAMSQMNSQSSWLAQQFGGGQ